MTSTHGSASSTALARSQSFWPDLATLWAAIEWRCAEARVLAVAAEMEALAIERGELREKLAGVRPW
jgi:hypothetical protein